MRPALTDVRARLRDCCGVLVDSNVLLDIATSDPDWSIRFGRALAECAEDGTLIINPIIYAEVSIRYTSIGALVAALAPNLYQREPLPWGAGFLAGKSFLLYRRRGGSRTSPLPDFYIGAHGAIRRLALLHPRCGPLSRLFSEIGDPRSRRARDVTRRMPRSPDSLVLATRLRPGGTV